MFIDFQEKHLQPTTASRLSSSDFEFCVSQCDWRHRRDILERFQSAVATVVIKGRFKCLLRSLARIVVEMNASLHVIEARAKVFWNKLCAAFVAVGMSLIFYFRRMWLKPNKRRSSLKKDLPSKHVKLLFLHQNQLIPHRLVLAKCEVSHAAYYVYLFFG